MKALALALAIVLIPGLVWAATPTLIRHRHGDGLSNGIVEAACGPNNKCTIQLPQASLANNLLVLMLRFDFSTGRTVTVVDDKSNTWTKAAATGSSGTGTDVWAFYSCGVAAGTQTIMLSFDSAQLNVFYDVYEFNNVATSSCLDNSSVNAGATSPIVNSGDLTTSATVSDPDLIVVYAGDTTFQGGTSTTPITGITAGTGFTLISADRYYGTTTEFATATSNAAFTPSVTVEGADGDIFGVIALAFKSAAAGTARGTGIEIIGIHELNGDGAVAANTYQVPTFGNAVAMITSIASAGGNLSSVDSSPANTWMTGCDTDCTVAIASTSPQFALTCNASVASTMTITLTLATAARIFWTFYDIDNADHVTASSCFDQEADVDTGNQSGDPDVQHAPDITPTNTNGLVIAQVAMGLGPPSTVTSPLGAVMDDIYYPSTLTTTGTLTAGDANITSLASLLGVEANMSVREPSGLIQDLSFVQTIIDATTITMSQTATDDGSGLTIFFGGKTDGGPELGDGTAHYIHSSNNPQNWTWRIRNQQQTTGLAATAIAIKAAVQFTGGSCCTIAPNPVDLGAAPGSFIVTGGGFADAGFGMPVVNFVGGDGALLGQVRATGLTGGATLTVPFPTNQNSLSGALPGLSAGAVTVMVYNQTSAGSFGLVGSASLTVTGCSACVSSIAPNPIDLGAAPGSFIVTGGGFADAGAGMPVINFVGSNGALLGQVRATGLTGGTTLTVPFPTNQNSLSGALPGLSAGAVTVMVYNQTSAGSFGLVGSASLTVTGCSPCVSSITPSPVDLGAAPGSFIVTGGGFADAGFGMPVVNFVGSSGALLGQVRAAGLTAGTTLTVPFPTNQNSLSGALPGLSAGAVTVMVYNQTSGGSFGLVGSTGLTVTGCGPCVSSITPRPVDLTAAPGSFIVTGGGFLDAGFGMPVVNFVGSSGALLGQVRATGLSGGTTLTVPFPTNQNSLSGALPGLGAGAVTVMVYNQTSAGSFTFVGSVSLTVN